MASDPLVSDAEVTSSWSGFTSIPDDERARLIRAASRSIEAYVGRTLGLTTVVESHRPENARLIYLRVRPVASITSVTYGNPAVTLDADAYTLLDAETGVVELYRSFPAGYRYPDRSYGSDPRAGRVTVTYSGGYATADVPDDIKQAAILTIRYSQTQATVQNGGYYESVQQGSYSYKISQTNSTATSTSGLPAEALGYVRSYRRPRLA